MQFEDLEAERYTAKASCILPMFSQVSLDEYTTYVRATGYQRITAAELLSTARQKRTYVEVSLEPFGLNIHPDSADMHRAEMEMLQEPTHNTILASNLEVAKCLAPTKKHVFEEVYKILARINRSENKEFAFYCTGANTLIVHAKTYSGKTSRNAIGMECIRKLYTLDGVRSVQIVNSHPPYIEVSDSFLIFSRLWRSLIIHRLN